ncbi:hypothetical protein HAX54_009700, partial [Datura stramonium]|nr:hypothetical protein [Datura stramonium]
HYQKGNRGDVARWLIQWKGLDQSAATSELKAASLLSRFPSVTLVNKGCCSEDRGK